MLNLQQPEADIYIPDGTDLTTALKRTTHLAIAAHPDDIEILAFHGISECYQRNDRWFSGITVTDGSGSPRSGPFRGVSDDTMVEVRRDEQRKAASWANTQCKSNLPTPALGPRIQTIRAW